MQNVCGEQYCLRGSLPVLPRESLVDFPSVERPVDGDQRGYDWISLEREKRCGKTEGRP